MPPLVGQQRRGTAWRHRQDRFAHGQLPHPASRLFAAERGLRFVFHASPTPVMCWWLLAVSWWLLAVSWWLASRLGALEEAVAGC